MDKKPKRNDFRAIPVYAKQVVGYKIQCKKRFLFFFRRWVTCDYASSPNYGYAEAKIKCFIKKD